MEKRVFYALLILLFLLPIINALDLTENELKIKVNSKFLEGNNITVNLKELLGEKERYFIANKLEHLDVKIDNGTALIFVEKGWKGEEYVLFTTNQSLKLDVGDFEKVKVDYLEELVEKLNVSLGELLTKQQYAILRDYKFEKENITYVKTEREENKLKIDIGKKANLEFEIGEEGRGIIIKDLALIFDVEDKEINIEEDGNYLFLILSLIILLGVCAFIGYYFRKDILKIFTRRKRKTDFNTLKRVTLTGLITLKRKLNSEESVDVFEEFSLLIRKFFFALLNINYEFTYEELIKEIGNRNIKHKTRRELISYFKMFLEKRYEQNKPKKEELRGLIERIYKIIKKL